MSADPSHATSRIRRWLADERTAVLAGAIALECAALALWPALYLANSSDQAPGIMGMFGERYPFTLPLIWAIKPIVDNLFPGALWSWEQLIAFIVHCFLFSCVAYALVCWRLTPRVSVSSVTPVNTRVGLRWLLIPLVVLQLTFVFIPSTMTTDIYNYAIYGEMPVLYDANPYVHTPQEFPQSPLYYLIPVYWHDAPSVYGPFWVSISAGVASIFRGLPLADELLAYRIIANASHFVNTWLVWCIARRMRPETAPSAAAAYGWNPLLLMEFAFNGHNDVLMLTLTLAALRLACSRQLMAGSFALGLSVATKYTSILAAPMLLAWGARRDAPLTRTEGDRTNLATVLREVHYGKLIIGGAAILGTLVVLYLPWIEGIGTFGPVLYWMTGPRSNNFWPDGIISMVTTTVANARHADWTAAWNDVFDIFKVLAKVGLVALILFEVLRVRAFTDVLASSARVFLFFLLLVNTWVMPWYFTWPLAISSALGWGDRLVRICAGFTMTAPILMYQRQWSQPLVDERGGVFLAFPLVLAALPTVFRLGKALFRYDRRNTSRAGATGPGAAGA